MEGKKVFISYGHDCSDLVIRIRKDLNLLGFETWVDISAIKEGDDWRASITKGIQESDYVLAFLSRHSLRKGSVCLSELAIAVGCRSGRVKTIVLEQNLDELIPSTISGVQYCDLSDYFDVRTDEVVFECWYTEKLSIIIRMLESQNLHELDTQLGFLERALSPNAYSSHRNTELLKPHVPRLWLENIVERWLKNCPVENFLLLVGPPGSGKSAFSAHYSHFNYLISSAVFCEWGCESYSAPKQIFKTMAFEIASKVPTYRQRLVFLLENTDLDLETCSARELFDLLFLHSTYGEIAADFDIVVIIDNIDEAGKEETDEISHILSSFTTRIPSNLKFVITTTDSNSVLRYFGDFRKKNIADEMKHVDEDIFAYIQQRMPDKLRDHSEWSSEKLVRRLVKKCEGSFLYAELLMDSITASGMSPHKAESLPSGLSGIYHDWMQRVFSGETFYESNYYVALSIIAAVGEPVPVAFLEKALGLKGVKLRRLLSKLNPLMRSYSNDFGEQLIFFCHQSFFTWATSELAGDYELDLDEGLNVAARTMIVSYEKGSLLRFEIENILHVLEKCRLQEECRRISEDDWYCSNLVDLAREYRRIPSRLSQALQIYRTSLGLLDARPDTERIREMRATLYAYIGQCQFAMGYYEGAYDTLSEHIDNIRSLSPPKETMRSISLLASLYDWKGSRNKSLEMFEALRKLAEQNEETHFIVSAYLGFAWFDHFSNLGDAKKKLDSLASLQMNSQDRLSFDLVYARMLLSAGKMKESMQMFQSCLESFDFEDGPDAYAFHKNRLLLIEVLPAYYDNRLYDKGIETGLYILKRVEDQGLLEECYCCYWLSELFVQKSQIRLARYYIDRAADCNRSMKELSRAQGSLWMEMNIFNARAQIMFETGCFDDAYFLYLKVLALAEGHCSDVWVAGDACFSLCMLLDLFLPGDFRSELDSIDYLKKISLLGRDSGLEHLQGKSKIMEAFSVAKSGNARLAQELVAEARNITDCYNRASMDHLQLHYYELRIAQLTGGGGDERLRLEEVVQNVLADYETEEEKSLFWSRTIPAIIAKGE